MTTRFVAYVIASTLLCAIPATGVAQTVTGTTWDPQGLLMDRTQLVDLLTQLEEVANSSGYSGRVRDQAERDADNIRDRLQNGDFRLGDQITLVIEGEPDLPSEYQVESGPQIVLPVTGAISLEGVLRSELDEYLRVELGRFYRDPVIQADARMRVTVLGAVGSPGFYYAQPTMLLSEVLMQAGQPSQSADLDEMRIERAGDVLWEGEEMAMILTEGRTLDQLNLRGGDQIVVPAHTEGTFLQSGWGSVLRWGLALGTSILFGVRVFL